MEKKKVVIALGHRALGNTLPEQKEATKRTAKIIAQLVKEGAEVVISHSNGVPAKGATTAPLSTASSVTGKTMSTPRGERYMQMPMRGHVSRRIA